MSLSEFERITLLMMRGYGDLVRPYEETMHLFNDTFPDRPPISKSTVFKTVKRFEETRTVKDRERSGRPKSATNELKSLDVLQRFVENPSTSARVAAEDLDMSHTSVLNVLHKNKYHPYKVTVTQELAEDDFDRRTEFCEIMMRKCDEIQNFLSSILFSDEATFFVNGQVNRHNCRYWADHNPHWMIEGHTQRPQKVNLWAGIINNNIVGPFVVDGNLTGEIYFNMLTNNILPAVRALLGANFNSVWFQQDGAPPHYYLRVRNLLDQVFPNRWIGRRGTVEWPARSPDLNPLDFFLWGFLKGNVYKTKPANIEELTNRLLEEARRITPEMLQNVTAVGFYNRLAHCQQVFGEQFEHLI